jgi:hypothetical protein
VFLKSRGVSYSVCYMRGVNRIATGDLGQEAMGLRGTKAHLI